MGSALCSTLSESRARTHDRERAQLERLLSGRSASGLVLRPHRPFKMSARRINSSANVFLIALEISQVA